jgi:hypothetical protein
MCYSCRHPFLGDKKTLLRCLATFATFLTLSACKVRQDSAVSADAPAPPARRPQTIFFHWASIESNNTLFNLAGVRGDGHEHDLYSGPSGTINEGVFAKLVDWYSPTKQDAAGAGFYFSTDILDSRAFGNDLVIVEIKMKDGSNIPVVKDLDIKEKSDIALENKSTSQLPLISFYGRGKWHVMSRVPTDADGIEVTFRPPTASDVEKFWTETVANNTPVQVIDILANLKQYLFKEGDHDRYRFEQTRGTEIFFERVFFDEGFAFIETLKFDSPELNKSFPKLVEIAEAFHKRIPDDPRTAKLIENLTSNIASRPAETLFESQLDIMRLHIERMSEVSKGVVASSFFNTVPKEFVSERFQEIVPIFALLKNSGIPTDVSQKMTEAIEEALRTRTGKITDPIALAPAIESLFPVEPSRDLVLELFTAKIQQTTFPDFSEITKMFDYLRSKSSERSIEFLGLILDGHPLEPGDPKITQLGEFALSILLDLPKGDPSEVALQARIKRADQKLATAGHGPPFLDTLFRKNANDEVKLRRLMEVIAEVSPRGIGYAVSVLQSMVARPDYYGLKTDKPITINQLISDFSKHVAQDLDAYAADQYKYFGKTIQSLMPLSSFRNKVGSTLQNISGSIEFSELSRTFILVDPLFVSEDIRFNDAKRPYERFNESFNYQGRNFTQKAWENFTNAWTQMFEFGWGRLRAPERYWNSNLAYGLAEIQKTIVTGYTDGTPQGTLYQNDGAWDRRIYETKFSKAEWDAQITDQRPQLEKIFDIITQGNDVVLKFKAPANIYRAFGLAQEPQAGNEILRLNTFICDLVFAEPDAIKRAAKILYLVPRIHPMINGNGRLARTWAATELMKEGLPPPVGLPTNDFLLSQEQMDWEVRKSLKLGALWQNEINKAKADGVPVDDFFQKRFRGSALEGLIHVQNQNLEELKGFVGFLEKMQQAPDWAREYMVEVERGIAAARQSKGTLAQLNELERDRINREQWKKFRESKFSTGSEPWSFSGSACGNLAGQFQG